jgi:hypothetical protein
VDISEDTSCVDAKHFPDVGSGMVKNDGVVGTPESIGGSGAGRLRLLFLGRGRAKGGGGGRRLGEGNGAGVQGCLWGGA